ncbi:isopentenyl-diphosphate Delta-isomerase [Endozoicomonas sp. Mp262]|uniref:isopentenyl-diphosphate Delta-isomerase n=1 Tax=Endozoicomonas sp. Mp262 TaxID=2919499 RepID=UPI0021DA5378
MTHSEHVILVDENGTISGQQEKLQAHITGELHQAFSVMLYRYSRSGEREYLLQQRAEGKYHSGRLWTNTCCSHPRINEDLEQACLRRLKEELGIDQPLTLQEIGVFCYHAQLDNNLIEHERDHVWVGEAVKLCLAPNPVEVMNCRWWSTHEIEQGLKENPAQFTAWFTDVFNRVKNWLNLART